MLFSNADTFLWVFNKLALKVERFWVQGLVNVAFTFLSKYLQCWLMYISCVKNVNYCTIMYAAL